MTLHLLKCHSCQSFVQLKLTRIQAAAGRTLFLLKPPLVCHPQSPAGRQGPGRHCGYWSHLSNSVKFKEKQQVNWNNNLSWNTKVSLRPLRNVSTREGRRANRTQRIECMKRSASYRMLEVQNLVQTKTKARVKIWHCFNLTLHVTKNRLQESSSPWPEWSSPCRPNGSPLQSVFCWSFHGGEISALPGIHFVPNYLSFVDESWKQMIISKISISTIWWWKIGIISWNLDLVVFPVSIISWLDLDMLTYSILSRNREKH